MNVNEVNENAQIKRFLERWQADSEFRRQLVTDAAKTVARYNLKVDPEEIRPLWDTEFIWNWDIEKLLQEYGEALPALKNFLEFAVRELSWPELRLLPGFARDPRFRAWRERQIARIASQFKQSYADLIAHIPFAFELTKGCSVGCWFCGVGASRLQGIFSYSQENAKLWREVLELISSLLGSAAATGICYMATDPFDNPDYEKFCSDFQAILGTFPQTTTAQALKDRERTRALLKLSREKGCKFNRFSILSLKMLDQVHEEFSAEELAFVYLALQNPESTVAKINAGRVRDRHPSKLPKNSKFLDEGTTACVSGFLVNMVDRSVKLISPCNADERWPLGYIIYEEGTFTNIEDLKVLLENMMANQMSVTIRPNDAIGFRRDLKYESLPNGFQVSTKYKTFKFRNSPHIKELGEVVNRGDLTAAQIASFLSPLGISCADTFRSLNLMFERGILDEERRLKNSHRESSDSKQKLTGVGS